MTEKANFFPIIARIDIPARTGSRAGRAIVAYRDPEQYKECFVSACQWVGDDGTYNNGWDSGFYTDDFKTALTDMVERASRFRPDLVGLTLVEQAGENRPMPERPARRIVRVK